MDCLKPADVGISTDHRRKWNLEEYQHLANKRLAIDDEDDGDLTEKRLLPKQRRGLLKARDFKVDLESQVGRSVIVRNNGSSSGNSTQGYYCSVCDCVVKDSINFLDHINGKKHQRNMGMSMKVEKSTVDQVKRRFEVNKQKLAERQREYDFKERLEMLQEEEAKVKEMRRIRRQQKRKKESGQHNNLQTISEPGSAENEALLLATMGFSSFAPTK